VADVAAACLGIALKILGYGFVPVGDARRYVAKAVTDKEYPQILVLGPLNRWISVRDGNGCCAA